MIKQILMREYKAYFICAWKKPLHEQMLTLFLTCFNFVSDGLPPRF
jgi:hypothetical protein